MTDKCDYQGYEFGAHYLDSVCIEGYLWDADSGNPGEPLECGGDIPCPQCNHDNWLAYTAEDISDQGYVAHDGGDNMDDCPYPPEKGEEYKPGDFAIFRYLWMWGFAEAKLNAAPEGLAANDGDRQ